PLIGVAEGAFFAALPARAGGSTNGGAARGIVHQTVAAAYRRLNVRAAAGARLITVDLSAASSVAALQGGRPIDVSPVFAAPIIREADPLRADESVRALLEAEADGDRPASLAVERYCYRARKEIGAALAALAGADAVLFGGEIAENLPAIRARVCAGLAWCGLVVDPGCN